MSDREAGPDRWRAKAREAFAAAREMSDPEAKAVMVKIASGYEHLADLVANNAAKDAQGHGPAPSEAPSEEQP